MEQKVENKEAKSVTDEELRMLILEETTKFLLENKAEIIKRARERLKAKQ